MSTTKCLTSYAGLMFTNSLFKFHEILNTTSGGSRGGAREDPAPSPLFWVRKEKITEGRKAGRASKTTPPPLAQGLDPTLTTRYRSHVCPTTFRSQAKL